MLFAQPSLTPSAHLIESSRLQSRMRLIKFALLVPLVAASPFNPKRGPSQRDEGVGYDGYHIYSVTPSSPLDARNLVQRFSRYHTHPIRETLSVAIPPDEVADFEKFGLDARLINSDLGASIRSIDNKPASYSRALHKRGELPDLSWYDSYHPYVDHLDYWDDLVHAFPKNSKKFQLGSSYENRTIYAYHLFGDQKKGGYGPKTKDKRQKPVILWHATVHAREVCAICCLFIGYLLTGSTVDINNGDRIPRISTHRRLSI